MKTLFLTFHGLSPANGISKKIQAQVKALNQCGLETELCYYSIDNKGNRVWISNEKIIKNLGSGFWGKLKKRICYKPLIEYICSQNISFLYIRSDHNANPFTINLVRKLKQHRVKIVLEVPTYPYDQEYITFQRKCHLLIDKLFRKKFASYLNAIITFSNEPMIFGQRTIQISNGIDFSSIPLKTNNQKRETEIHLIGVAEIHYWHGYDRLISGIADYYQSSEEKKKQVYFHIVGGLSGDREIKEIVNPIKRNNLEKYVIMHGPLFGDKLDKVFDLADIAIGSLGRHRSNITHIKTLKNREYAARGIPFIYSEIDDDFETMPYIMKIPADESKIDINKIISFHSQCSIHPKEIRESVDFLSWSNQMQHIINSIYKV